MFFAGASTQGPVRRPHQKTWGAAQRRKFKNCRSSEMWKCRNARHADLPETPKCRNARHAAMQEKCGRIRTHVEIDKCGNGESGESLTGSAQMHKNWCMEMPESA